MAEGYTWNNFAETSVALTGFDNTKESQPSLKMGLDNVTLTAQAKAETYTITLDNNNGTAGSTSVDVTYNSNVITAITNPTKVGHEFLGWTLTADAEDYVIIDNAFVALDDYTATVDGAVVWARDLSDEDITIFAKWTPETYTVALNNNGGENGSDSVTVTYGSSEISTITNPTRTGYVFVGWTLVGGINMVIENNALVVIEGYTTTVESVVVWNRDLTYETLSFYAKWTPETYTITLDSNDGENGSTEVTVTYASSAISTITNPTRNGYTFLGWTLDKHAASETATDFVIKDGALVALEGYTTTVESVVVWNRDLTDETLTVYAKWGIGSGSYKVEYYLEKVDGEYALDTAIKASELSDITTHTTTMTADTESEVEIDQTVKYEHFTLDLTHEDTVTSGIVSGSETIVLRLYYTRARYTVTVVRPEKGVVAVTGEGTYKYNDEVTLEATLKAGYDFVTFDGETDGTTNPYTFNIAGDVEFAIEVESQTKSYTIKFRYENLDGEYVENANVADVTVADTAKVDDTVKYADIKTIVEDESRLLEGFEFDDVNDLTIGVDEATNIMIVKYGRKDLTLTLTTSTGVAGFVATGLTANAESTENANVYTVKYEQVINLSATIAAGYEFASWSNESVTGTATAGNVTTGQFVMTATSTSLSVNVNAVGVEFTIKYYVENLQSTGGDDLENDYTYKALKDDGVTSMDGIGHGITGEDIESLDGLSLETIAGFKCYTFSASGKIAGDGSTVLNVYYIRDTITVTLEADEGIDTITATVENYNNAGETISYTFPGTTSFELRYGGTIVLASTVETDEDGNTGYTAAEFEGATFADGKYTFTAALEDVTIKAMADNNTYNVSFYANIAADETATVETATYNQEFTMIKAFARTGYTPLYWSTDKATKAYELDETFTYLLKEDLTLYMIWSENRYTIEYVAGEGSTGTMDADEDILYTAEHTLKANKFGKVGYTFAGWTYVDDEGKTQQLVDEGKVTGLTATAGKIVTLTAQWTENSYTVKYKSNYPAYAQLEGVVVTDADYLYTALVTIKDVETVGFEVTGYAFAGWTRNAEGTGKVYVANETADKLAEEGEVVFYATWTENAHEITYNANGGEGEMAATPVDYSKSVTLAKATFKRTAYTFEGWSTTAGGEVEYADEDAFTCYTDSDTELFAVWTPITYTITYKANEGEFKDVETDENGNHVVEYTVEDEITLLTQVNITYVGYRLLGYTREGYDETTANWHTLFTGDISLPQETLEAGLYGDVVLVAKWEKSEPILTVRYVKATEAGDVDVAQANIQAVPYNGSVTVVSPEVVGYVTDQVSITVTMDSLEGKEVKVYYTAVEYTITLDTNKKANTTGDITSTYETLKVIFDSAYSTAYTAEGTVVGLPTGNDITRVGYTFGGWFTDANCTAGNEVEASDIVKTAENHTIYAKWDAAEVTYAVDFRFENLAGDAYVEGSVASIEDATALADTTLTEADILKLFATEDDADGAMPTVDGFEYRGDIKLAKVDANGETRIIVNYSRKYFTLTVVAGDGVSVTAATEETNADDENFYIEDFNNGTYSVRFEANVVLTKTTTDEGYAAGDFVVETETDADGKFVMNGDTTVTVETTPRDFTITFNGLGGKDSKDAESYTQTGTYKETLVLTENDFTREGYHLLGWSTDEAGERRDYTDKDNFTLEVYATNVDLYAVWEANTYELKIVPDKGIDASKLAILVNGTCATYAETISVKYADTIKVDATNALVAGYEFEGFEINDVAADEAGALALESTIAGDTVIDVLAKEMTGISFNVVYALSNWTDTNYTDSDPIVCNQGTTDKVVTYTDLTGWGLVKAIEGFMFSGYTDRTGAETVTIKYAEEAEDYTTIYLNYTRQHYGLTLNTAGTVGVQSFEPYEIYNNTISGATSTGYNIYFETIYDVVLNMQDGYEYTGFTATATMGEGSKALVDGETSWTLTWGNDGVYDGFYFNGEKVMGFALNEETGRYEVSGMPAYYITITPVTNAKVYDITYNKNAGDGTEEVTEQVTYNEAYSIRYIAGEKFNWIRTGYNFLGWAIGAEEAARGEVDERYAVSTFMVEEGVYADKAYDAYTDLAGKTLYAVWQATKQTYEFRYYFETVYGTYEEDVSMYVSTTGETNEFVEIAIKDKTGFEFDTNNENNVLSGNVPAEGSLTLVAYYTRKAYTLTINADEKAFNSISIEGVAEEGKTLKADAIKDVNFNPETNVLTATVLHGVEIQITSTFETGYENANYAATDVTFTDGKFVMTTADLVVTATASPKYYTITFNGNGGTTEAGYDTHTQSIQYTTTVKLDANPFKQTGFHFVHWEIVIGGETKTFENGTPFEYSVAEDLTAIAIWEENTDTAYTVNYFIYDLATRTYIAVGSEELVGITNSTIEEATVKATFETLDLTAYGVEKAGFTFGRIRESGDDLVIAPTGDTEINVEYDLATFGLTIDWTVDEEENPVGIDSIEVAYNSSEAENNMFTATHGGTQQVEYTSSMTFTIAIAEGYKLNKVTITGEGLKQEYTELEDGNTITYTMPCKAIAVNVDVEVKTFTITYFKNFDEDLTTKTTQAVSYFDTFAFNGTFSVEGHTLLGWADEANATEAQYDLAATYEGYPWDADKELYAVWEANAYTIKYNYNGGEGTLSDIDTVYGEIEEIAGLEGLTRAGYTATAWSTSVDTSTLKTVESVDAITESGIYFSTADSKYYAYNLAGKSATDTEATIYVVWTPITYTIVMHYDSVDGAQTHRIENVAYGSQVTLPSLNDLEWAIKESYDFGGWTYVNGAGESKFHATDESTKLTLSNLTTEDGDTIDIYARWFDSEASITIRIMLEKLTGGYDETDKSNYVDIEDYTYDVGSTITSAIAYNNMLVRDERAQIEGFTYNVDKNINEGDSQLVTRETAAIIRVYYSRNSYNLTLNKAVHATVVLESGEAGTYAFDSETGSYIRYTVKYQAKVTLGFTLAAGYENGRFAIDTENSAEGYALEADGVSVKMLAGEVAINLLAAPKTDTPYRIEVYMQQLDLGYAATADKVIADVVGTTAADITDAMLQAEVEKAMSVEGFTYATFETVDGTDKIAGDGSTVVKVKYTRDHFSITIENVDVSNAFVTLPENEDVLYGQAVSLEYTLNKGYLLETTSFTLKNDDGDTLTLDLNVAKTTNSDGYKVFTLTFTMPAENVSVKAEPAADPNVKYTVVYMFQNEARDGYVEDPNYPAVEKYGETGKRVSREDVDFGELLVTGFECVNTNIPETEETGEQIYIKGDESTVVYIYYDRVVKNVTLIKLDNNMQGIKTDTLKVVAEGKEIQPTTNMQYAVAYGQRFKVTFEMADGFVFDGFVVNGQSISTAGTTLEYTMGADSLEIEISLKANTDTPYVVKYYKEEVSADGSSTTFKEIVSKTLVGTTHKALTEIKKDYVDRIADVLGSDYVADDFYGLEYSRYTAFMNGKEVDEDGLVQIAGDGSTEIYIYYKLTTVMVKVEYESKHVSSVTGAGEYQFGATVNLAATIKAGYGFKSWTITWGTADDETMVITSPEYSFEIKSTNAYEIVLETEPVMTAYTIKHYFEDIADGKYVEKAEYTTTSEGLTESEIDLSTLVRVETGYTYSHNGNNNKTYVVAGDGSTVVELYYRLNTVEFTITLSNGITAVNVLGYTDQTNIELISSDAEHRVYTYRTKYSKHLLLSVTLEDAYQFSGWFLNDSQEAYENSTDENGFNFKAFAENFTFRAMAAPGVVTIVFDPNNGSSEVIEEFEFFGATYTLRYNTFTYDNRTFLGWALTADGDVAYYDGAEITLDLSVLNEDGKLVLYAVWEEPESNMMLIIIIIIVVVLLILIIIIIIIIVKKKNNKKMKYMSKQ
ncbi:MAG: InlB B-repeat-containing protein [Clostridia bacterium]|nr:InlB B-repeat-containing protein [Clostridia bacterium]